MTRDELFELSAEKALRELTWKSIEFLFQPQNQLELWLRLDFEGTREKIYKWITYDGPDGVPHRFRPPHTEIMLRDIKLEEFYRLMKKKRVPGE